MKKIKVNSDTVIGIALGTLGLVQLVLSNKKEANNRKVMKQEIISEVVEELKQ